MDKHKKPRDYNMFRTSSETFPALLTPLMITANHTAAPNKLLSDTFRSCQEGIDPARKTNAATLNQIPVWPCSHQARGILSRIGDIATGKEFHHVALEQETEPSCQVSPLRRGQREKPLGEAEKSRAAIKWLSSWTSVAGRRATIIQNDPAREDHW